MLQLTMQQFFYALQQFTERAIRVQFYQRAYVLFQVLKVEVFVKPAQRSRLPGITAAALRC